MAEAGFGPLNAVPTKRMDTLHVGESGDLLLELSNVQPNVSARVNDHQVHPSLS